MIRIVALRQLDSPSAPCLLQPTSVTVQMDQDAAVRLIASLAQQIMRGSENAGRIEFWTDTRQFFTVSVHPTVTK